MELRPGSSSAALVDAIVGMAGALGLTVVAEGVEEAAQLAEVRARGCDAAQGYLFMRPSPPEALSSLLELDHLLPDEASTATQS